jgi:hypothetical protein
MKTEAVTGSSGSGKKRKLITGLDVLPPRDTAAIATLIEQHQQKYPKAASKSTNDEEEDEEEEDEDEEEFEVLFSSNF